MEDRSSLPMPRASQYAVRLLVHLARLGEGESATVAAIAGCEGIPAAFLSKIARNLVRAGLVESCRGPGGGVRLARPAHTIGVLEAIEAAGDERFLGGCLLGLGTCSDETPCALHGLWAGPRERLRAELAAATIGAIASGTGGGAA